MQPLTIEQLAQAHHRIRILNGPLRGMVVDTRRSVYIGRAHSCDVRLPDPGVSRTHAVVLEHPWGGHYLVDGGSTNGTWVDGVSIRHRLLRPGVAFEIMGTTFVFEEWFPRSPVGVGAQMSASSYAHAFGRRCTREIREVPETTPGRGAGGSGAPMAWPLDAIDHEGRRYDGSLIEDIVELRALRLRRLRQRLDAPVQLDRIERLERRLLIPSTRGSATAYRFFRCEVPAGLRRDSGPDGLGLVLELGAWGAMVRCSRHGLAIGTKIWLAIELVSRDRRRTVVLESEVTWRDHEHVMLAFTFTSSSQVTSEDVTFVSAPPRPGSSGARSRQPIGSRGGDLGQGRGP